MRWATTLVYAKAFGSDYLKFHECICMYIHIYSDGPNRMITCMYSISYYQDSPAHPGGILGVNYHEGGET